MNLKIVGSSPTNHLCLKFGLVAQLAEHGSEVPSVGGSIPSQSINRGLLAQLVRALGS